ncbi:MAG: hypothetical protein M1835_001874 [Candelina submexicana]|nr:MAG: hypothetical protein M1835_001874 [Candelina submexicana]
MNNTDNSTGRPLEPPFPAEYSLSPPSPKLPSHLLNSSVVLLPGNAVIPNTSLPTYLATELSVSRLNAIHKHIWLAGRTGNTHALHQQKMIGREICRTEQTDLHLVWLDHSIFIKPLAPFLLDHDFFAQHICLASSNLDCPLSESLFGAACGLLYSYAQLIRHESDFHIATSQHLLPADLTWQQWLLLSAHLHLSLPTPSIIINKRYNYGELRLSRLNLIMRFLAPSPYRSPVRGYYVNYREYGTFFSRKLGWLVLVFAYLSVILSAMQVGQVKGVKAFDDASWGFAVAVIVALCATLGLIVAMFIGLFLWNSLGTLTEQRKRAREKRKRDQQKKEKEDNGYWEESRGSGKLGAAEV